MKNLMVIFFASFFLLNCSSDREADTVSSINNYAQLKSLFADPPSEYRSAPLWDWNDKITEEGIAFQMKEFKKAGIGGVFVHPRPGLITEYLSEEWFHLFDYTVQKGKELGMKVWIYDENSYPSGFAGGRVPAECGSLRYIGCGSEKNTYRIYRCHGKYRQGERTRRNLLHILENVSGKITLVWRIYLC
jgi:hypothetical protein